MQHTFPSIEAFRHLIKNIPYIFPENAPEVLNFTGTVKLHGSHCDIIQENGEIFFQSRNRILSIEKDNEGCARFLTTCMGSIKNIFEKLSERIGTSNLMIAGEYCGKGIQSKVAICKLPRMFVAFGIKRLDANEWLDFSQYVDIIEDKDNSIYNIYLAPTYNLTVTLSDSDEAVKVFDELTKHVDTQCPFALALGANGPGEGIVWKCIENTSENLWFKTKGATHVTPIAPVLKSKDDIMEKLVMPLLTEQRMEQGVSYLLELGNEKTIKNINIFSEWVCNDVIKEELDVLEESAIPILNIRKQIKLAACEWYKNNINNLIL